MKNFKRFVFESFNALKKAIFRFPLTVTALVAETSLVCYVISIDTDVPIPLQKWIFILMVAAFAGLATQFSIERFDVDFKRKVGLNGLALGFIVMYALIIWPSPEIDYLVGARSSVTVFSLLCLTLWMPSYKEGFNFNQVALVHFKSLFTTLLYAGVLNGGLAAILAAINLLLFRLDSNIYGYTAAIVWILFATLYFLSLLPKFNAKDEDSCRFIEDRIEYPKLLRILVSTIAIPLLSAYSLVLFSYFIKILFTQNWPIGQLGPMILGYSMAGFILYILARHVENRFSKRYIVLFPFVLIPIVSVQLISIVIRLNAYGFTESRYYLMLFGVYSLLMGILLSFKIIKKQEWIAIIAMGFALVSVIPPLDAFSVSRNSQKSRLENLLSEAGILQEGKLFPSEDVEMTLRLETTSILEYMNRRNYLTDLEWLPKEFAFTQDFKETFGFETSYAYYYGETDYFYAGLNMKEPFNIEGFDFLFQHSLYRQEYEPVQHDFEIITNEKTYTLKFERLDEYDVLVSVLDAENEVLVQTHLYPFVEYLKGLSTSPKDQMDVSEMTFDTHQNGIRLRIIFQFINVVLSGPDKAGADYDVFALVDIQE